MQVIKAMQMDPAQIDGFSNDRPALKDNRSDSQLIQPISTG